MSPKDADIRPDRPSSIRRMFTELAPDYDRLNELLTFGRVRAWRRAMVRAAGIRPGDRAVDVCAGTGASLATVRDAVGPKGMAVGIDFTPAMLERAAGCRVLGDAVRLPFADGVFDAAVSAFALRDVADQRACLAEMARVTHSGGGVAVLEVGRPRRQPFRGGFDVWFRGVVPRLGAAFGQGESHRFLARSISYLPEPEALVGMLEDVGVLEVRVHDLTLGAARLFSGRRG